MNLDDLDFRTLVCIDLLLDLLVRTDLLIRQPSRSMLVFTSVLLDGWQTGPRGTPSAINTASGWVPFGKIQGNNVVDIANLTLEHEILKDIAGFTQTYTATLAKKEKTSTTRNGGRHRVKGQAHFLKRESSIHRNY